MNKEKNIKEIISKIRESNNLTGLSEDKKLLTILLYLSDWKSCIEVNKPISKIRWTHGEDGLEADINIDGYIEKVEYSGVTRLKESIKHFFDHKRRLETIAPTQEKLIENMMSNFKTDDKGRIFLIAKSTYPMMVTSENDKLNLKQICKKYKYKFQKEKK